MQENSLHNVKSEHKWAEAIEYAELKIRRHKYRIRTLRRSIRIFKEQMEAGEPWLGSEKGGEG